MNARRDTRNSVKPMSDPPLRENDLLRFIAKGNARLPDRVAIPPGDDMAMICVGSTDLLVAVDPLIEHVHFTRTNTTPELIGRKALTRNLSDIAAMAALPVAAVAAAHLPADTTPDFARRLVRGLQDTAEAFDCPIVGGDVAIQPVGRDAPLSLTITVLAEPAGIEPIRRRTAIPGDAVFITGQLGGSLQPDGTGHHLTFTPRTALARALAGDPATRPTSMMDLSDGLAMDLPRLVEHAQIETARLPLRNGIVDLVRGLGDGEDYELLFTAAPHATIPDTLEGVPLTRIGTVQPAGGVRFLDSHGQPIDTAKLGWEHGPR